MGLAGKPPRHLLSRPQKLGLAVSCLLLLWLTIAVSTSRVFAQAPDFVLTLAPFDAKAKAAKALLLLAADNRPERVRSAQVLATDALRRDPSLVEAVTALALAAGMQNQPDRALHLFQHSEKLSRRDLMTQLWLLEFNSQSGSISGALRHMDTALRTSRSAGNILFPILINASEDPEIALPLNELLQKKPIWWRNFIPELFSRSESAETIVSVTRDVFDPRATEDQTFIGQLITRLVVDKEYLLAWQVHESANIKLGKSVSRTQVVDGGFDHEPSGTPFGWSIVSERDLGAARQLRDGGSNPALFLTGRNGRGGEVARQLLVLPPGRYQLTAVAGNIPVPGQTLITVKCANSEAERLVLAAPLADQSGKPLSGSFLVPGESCTAQWLRVELRSSDRPEESWIDSINLVRL